MPIAWLQLVRDRVRCIGNIKQNHPRINKKRDELSNLAMGLLVMIGANKVYRVAASTHPGEDDYLLRTRN